MFGLVGLECIHWCEYNLNVNINNYVETLLMNLKFEFLPHFVSLSLQHHKVFMWADVALHFVFVFLTIHTIPHFFGSLLIDWIFWSFLTLFMKQCLLYKFLVSPIFTSEWETFTRTAYNNSACFAYQLK